MRQTHEVGDKLFADYLGKKSHIVDRTIGELGEVELFVAVDVSFRHACVKSAEQCQ
jgi:hypothetical protein